MWFYLRLYKRHAFHIHNGRIKGAPRSSDMFFRIYGNEEERDVLITEKAHGVAGR